MSAQISLSLAPGSGRDALALVTADVEHMARQDGWPDDLTFRVHLVLEELILNVMDYGLDEDSKGAALTVGTGCDSVTIEIVDDGLPFDPLTDAPDPDLTGSIEDRRIGGLGVHLTRTLMDEVVYKREDGKNRLTIVTSKVK